MGDRRGMTAVANSLDELSAEIADTKERVEYMGAEDDVQRLAAAKLAEKINRSRGRGEVSASDITVGLDTAREVVDLAEVSPSAVARANSGTAPADDDAGEYVRGRRGEERFSDGVARANKSSDSTATDDGNGAGGYVRGRRGEDRFGGSQ